MKLYDKTPFIKIIIIFLIILINVPGIIRANDINGSMTFGGKNRTYLLHIPSGYSATNPTPLVLVFHGLTGTGSMMSDITQFSPLADQENFIVVYPDGLNKKWSSPSGSVDDVGFISALIDLLSANYNIDAERIFATGASNGGMFTYRLALELTDRIAAVAVVSGYLPGYSGQPYPVPSRPISVLHFHGTTDPTIPYTEAEDATDYWVDFDNCTTTPQIVSLPNTVPTDGTTVDKMTYGNGSNNTEVNLYKIYNGGHTWPGTASHAMPGTICKDINATEIIWEFFKIHSMNATPTVSITNPLANLTLTAPASVLIKATASDADGSIQQVEFFNGKNSLKKDATALYNYLWKNIPAGVYTLRAIATDNQGATSVDSITFTVNPLKTSLDNNEVTGEIATLYDATNESLVISQPNADSEYDLRIYNSSGEKILSLPNIHDTKELVSTNSFARGLYVYCINQKDHDPETGKFLVVH